MILINFANPKLEITYHQDAQFDFREPKANITQNCNMYLSTD